MPRVLNKRTDWIPQGAVYVGRAAPRYKLRSSKWSNPMTVREVQSLVPGLTKREAHQVAVSWYRRYLQANAPLRSDLSELKGKDLVCWCAPLPCHANILLELANKERP